MKYIIFFFLAAISLKAQNLQSNIIVPESEHIVKSTINYKTYRLYVSLPVDYNPENSLRYPVLYILDAKYSYPIISSVHELLEYSGDMGKTIIVAIGDEDLSSTTWHMGRTADYTPSNDPVADREIAGGANIELSKVHSGGAKAFLETIRRDIIPFIEKKYKTTNERGIAGHSLGGLFAGYCLLNSPDLFQKYGVSSPSLFWNNNEIVESEKLFALKHKKLNGKVFISVGSREPEVMYPSINSFVSSLKEHNYEGLSVTYQLFENETHASVMAVSISRMLRVLYGNL